MHTTTLYITVTPCEWMRELKQCRTVLKQCRTVLKQCRTVLKQCRTVLKQCRTVLKQCRTVLKQCRTVADLNHTMCSCEGDKHLHVIMTTVNTGGVLRIV